VTFDGPETPNQRSGKVFDRIISVLDAQVKPMSPAASADADIYDGIPCRNEGEPRPWCWCPGCQEEAERRDAVSRPLPAEASCCVPDDAYDSDFDGFISEDSLAMDGRCLNQLMREYYSAVGTIR